MPHPFFFLCPVCFSEDSIHSNKCSVCNSFFLVKGGQITVGNQEFDYTTYYEFLLQHISVKQSPEIQKESSPHNFHFRETQLLRTSYNSVLRQGIKTFHFRGYHHIFSQNLECPVHIQTGHLILYEDHVEFMTKTGKVKWLLRDFTCITTNGHYFEFKIKKEPFYQIKFSKESPLKYEIIFKKLLSEYYKRQGRSAVVEYQPVIRSSPPKNLHELHIPAPSYEEQVSLFEAIIIKFVQQMVKGVFRVFIELKIHGVENWEKGNTGFVIVNHQSAFDPFIIGAFLDRRIAFLTKSTSFFHRFSRYCLRWFMGLPTTRYQTDPTVCYTIIKFISRNIKIGIFPEGERTWSGQLQSFKLSTVKILMASRQAIYPIVLRNTYRFWPRWAKFPRKSKVDMQIGYSFSLIPNLYSVNEQRQFLESYFNKMLDGSRNSANH